MADDKGAAFHGVPADIVAAIGRLVIAAGVVESIAREILLDLGLLPGNKMAANVLDSIRKVARRGLPPLVAAHAKTSTADLANWAERAKVLLDARNPIVHAAPVSKQHEGQFVLLSRHLRSGDLTPSDRGAVAQLAQDLSDCAGAGRRVHAGLLRSPREPVYLRNTYIPGEAWVMVLHGSDPNVPRPTDDEQAIWWRELGPWWVLGDTTSEPSPGTTQR